MRERERGSESESAEFSRSCAECINRASRLIHWKCLKSFLILCPNILGLHCVLVKEFRIGRVNNGATEKH